MSARRALIGACLIAVAATEVAAAVLQVGPTRAFTMPCQARAAAVDGDTIEIDAGVYAGEVCTWTANGLTLRGVGGRAWLQAPAIIPNGKAIWVIAGDDTLVENVEFSGAAVIDMNGAGIRQEGTNLTVRGCSFHDNQEGILTGADPASTILIEDSEFARNGAGDGFSHNMYIGDVGTFILRRCWTHAAVVGHEVKSRAAVNYIEYNRITDDATGTASYSIDLPNGGIAYVIGNVIQQGPLTQNSAMVTFAQEGATHPVQELYVVNNTMVNDLGRGRFVNVAGAPAVSMIVNNIFWGGGTALTGIGTLTSNLDGIDPLLVDRAGGDYHLLAGSPAIDAGTDPGTGSGYPLTPVSEYVTDLSGRPRATSGTAIDIGAFEFSAGGAGLTLHRGVVASYAPGWRAAAFPLTSLNDDESAPFPMSGLASPVQVIDTNAPSVPLVLYLLLDQPGDAATLDVLRVTRVAGGVAIAF